MQVYFCKLGLHSEKSVIFVTLVTIFFIFLDGQRKLWNAGVCKWVYIVVGIAATLWWNCEQALASQRWW